jgi:hypothetical protein
LTLPTSGTLSTLAGAENLSNKTLVAPILSGTAVGPLTLSGNLNTDGTFEFTGSSNYGIGAVRNASAQVYIGGSFAPSSGSHGEALAVRTTVTAEANQDGYGVLLWPTIATAGGGTHLNVEAMELVAPTITDNGASITNATTLHVVGAPSAGTNRYAMWVEGTTRIQGHALVGGMTDLPNNLMHVGGNWAPSEAASVSGLAVKPNITAVANQNAYALSALGDITKAGSGTHSKVATADFEPMNIGGSGSTITDFSTVQITGAPSGGTNNYSLYVVDGLTRLATLRVKGLTGSSTAPNNLSGTCTFSSSTQCSVTFANAEPDANYYVVLGCDTQCGRWGSRTTTGFTINTQSSNSGTCHWMIFR